MEGILSQLVQTQTSILCSKFCVQQQGQSYQIYEILMPEWSVDIFL